VCFAPGSLPPAPPGGAVPIRSTRVAVGAGIGRHVAAAAGPSPAAAIVLPDGRGLHPYYERLAEQLAGAGVDTVAIDLYGRTAGTGERGADFPSREHSARLRWAQVQDDLAAAADLLRGPAPHRPVITVGFCLGGRVSLLAATVARLDLAGAVAFYAQLAGPTRSDLPAPADTIDELRCPVLGLFGGADELVPVADVTSWRERLAASGHAHDVVVYPAAPHSFFDRDANRFGVQSADAWRRLLEFAGRAGAGAAA
jgi:carboxymethylenebutenolidase